MSMVRDLTNSAPIGPDFIPGKTWPGRIPSDKQIEDGGMELPVAMQKKGDVKRGIPEIEQYNADHPDAPLNPREQLFCAIIHNLVREPGNLHSQPPHYVKITTMRAALLAKGYTEEEVAAFTDGERDVYMQKYFDVFGKTAWQEAKTKRK
jgi:hypothetical protein